MVAARLARDAGPRTVLQFVTLKSRMLGTARVPWERWTIVCTPRPGGAATSPCKAMSHRADREAGREAVRQQMCRIAALACRRGGHVPALVAPLSNVVDTQDPEQPFLFDVCAAAAGPCVTRAGGAGRGRSAAKRVSAARQRAAQRLTLTVVRGMSRTGRWLLDLVLACGNRHKAVADGDLGGE